MRSYGREFVMLPYSRQINNKKDENGGYPHWNDIRRVSTA